MDKSMIESWGLSDQMSRFNWNRSKLRPRKLLLTAVQRERTSPTTNWAQAWRLRPPRRNLNASVAFTLPYFMFWPHFYSQGMLFSP
ncbi:unnamed protein product [Euphydryas editha]|uniref:Uncharacterized protein n=1 Tax=Euphydryas editha TaxID=104508 RepID=A0AAU9V323_EUPED|nr:unnamed protein product [Euphydryas editha]